jgi:hypothetical protein
MNRDGYSAQLFKADKYGNLDFSLCVDYETPEARKRAELMRRAPEMLAALQDIKALWDREGVGSDNEESEGLYHRLLRLIAGM